MYDVKSDFFNSLTAKLLYITKSKIPDTEPVVYFLTTRFAKSNVGDWRKLRRCISHLNQTVEDVRIIGGFNLADFFKWVDVSYAVHPNMHIHTGVVMSMGYGILHFQSSKKNMNEKSST